MQSRDLPMSHDPGDLQHHVGPHGALRRYIGQFHGLGGWLGGSGAVPAASVGSAHQVHGLTDVRSLK